ncbi:MAG: ParB/RepB/Spo0J family partition protein [Bacteroidetes bacterium]|nr:ParB/RepB/Spo0J family partition protein [Bacteroidota bacterium]
MSKNKSALGRGLGALLENAKTDITTKATENAAVVGTIAMIPVKNIEANPFQPRTDFEETALQELVDSIKEHGIIQPVTVRKLGFDKYQLISGERRFRSSQLVGLKEIPAYVRIANDQAMLEMALVENIQRADLNPIEVALSYKRLIDECNITQEQLADKVSKQRSTVTNFLRLLKLPAELQLGLKDKLITMGHARALINIEDKDLQLALFAKAVEENLSVRDIEELAKYGKVHTKVKVKTKQQQAPLSLSDKKLMRS